MKTVLARRAGGLFEPMPISKYDYGAERVRRFVGVESTPLVPAMPWEPFPSLAPRMVTPQYVVFARVFWIGWDDEGMRGGVPCYVEVPP